MVGVKPTTDSKYVLGDAFLRAWYSVYDYGQNRVGLAKNLESTAQLIVRATPFPTWAIVLIVIVGVLLVLGVAFIVYRWRKLKKAKTEYDSEKLSKRKRVNESENLISTSEAI